MLCSTCSKLAVLFIKKNCLGCGGIVNKNITVICDICSNNKSQCAACLKIISKNKPGGCKCGK